MNVVILILDVVFVWYIIIKFIEICWKLGVWKCYVSMDFKFCFFSKKIFMNIRYISVFGKIIFIVINNEVDY